MTGQRLQLPPLGVTMALISTALSLQRRPTQHQQQTGFLKQGGGHATKRGRLEEGEGGKGVEQQFMGQTLALAVIANMLLQTGKHPQFGVKGK
jgi:hypothetical protein